MKMKEDDRKKMKERKRKARVTACILLIAWNPSRELQTLPSDRPPASLALSLRRRRRRRRRTTTTTGRERLYQTICDIQYIYSRVGEIFNDLFGAMSGLLFRIVFFSRLSLKYSLKDLFHKMSSSASSKCVV